MKFGIPMAIKRHFSAVEKRLETFVALSCTTFEDKLHLQNDISLTFDASCHLKQKAKCFCLRSWSDGNFSSKIFFVACAIMARLISVAPKMLLRVGIF